MAAEEVSIERDGPDAARRELERCVVSGGVALFPADGLYGLACDPLSEEAIARIHRIKGRDEGKSSAVMYFSPLALRELVREMPPPVREAAAALLPGPVTLIVPNPGHRYPLACREDPGRLGLRLIEGPLAGVMAPVFQTSANRSGAPAPTAFGEVAESVRAAADLAIDGGELTGRPSTVIDLTGYARGGEWTILREGALTADELTARLGSAPEESGCGAQTG